MASSSAFLALLASLLGVGLHRRGLFDQPIHIPARPAESLRACSLWEGHELPALRGAFVDAALYSDHWVEALVGLVALLTLCGVLALLLVFWRCVSCRQQPPRSVRRSLKDGDSRSSSRGPAMLLR